MCMGTEPGRTVPEQGRLRFVVAPDSFKESMTAQQAAAAMVHGLRKALPKAAIAVAPLSDGGEGFTATMAESLGLRLTEVPAQDALGRPRTGLLAVGEGLAVLEVASAVGLEWIAPAEREVLRASSYGVGQLISAALDAGARRLLVGLGGSATNDGGLGMLRALGAQFWTDDGRPVTVPSDLPRLARVDLSGLDARLGGVDVQAACDVTNPLTGPSGASAIFGPQKGATPAQVEFLDAALAELAQVSGRESDADAPGAGAAGGLGFALMAFLDARLRPGAELVMETVGLAELVANATVVLTGEGAVDSQTSYGKVPAAVTALSRELGVPVVLFAGQVCPGAAVLLEQGVRQLVEITPPGQPHPQALAGGAANLATAVERWATSTFRCD